MAVVKVVEALTKCSVRSGDLDLAEGVPKSVVRARSGRVHAVW